MISVIALFAIVSMVSAAVDSAEEVKATPNTSGLFGGIVHQPNPGAYFNMTLSMTPTGSGIASFWNPALGFRCLGALTFHSGQTYLYNLQVDHSNQQGLCTLWGNVLINVGPGYIQAAMYPLGQAQPVFNAQLTQWV